MSYVNGTTHYNLPQTIGSDKRDWSDTNKAFADIDEAIYEAENGVNTLTPQVNNIQTELSDTKEDVTQNIADVASLGGRVTTTEQNINHLNNEVIDVRNDSEDMITSHRETSATSSRTYSVGDYFIYNDTLYIATKNIAQGSTIVPNTNCNTITVTSAINSLITSKLVELGDISNLTFKQICSNIYDTIHSLIGDTSVEKMSGCSLVFQRENTYLIYHLSAYATGVYNFADVDVDSNGGVNIYHLHISSSPKCYLNKISGTTVSQTNIENTDANYSKAYLIYF